MRRLRFALLACAALLALTLVLAGPAAAFRGADGELVVQPLRGAGLVLVSPTGAGAARVCTNAALCGLPGAPRFSPSGAALAFVDLRTGRPVVLSADGSCLWCLLGAPLTPLTGTGVAFTPNGLSLGLTAASGLQVIALDGARGPARPAGPLAQAVWSSQGELAFVRAGEIWVAPRGRAPHRVAAGTAPAFTPDGRTVVFAAAGWLWRVPSRGGRPRRLVRGRAPVVSPDGRHLAFIGAGGRVEVSGLRGRGARALPGVRGRSIDWQPLPHPAPAPCPVRPGATVVAQTGAAVLMTNPGDPSAPWAGCLAATGTRWALGQVAAGATARLTGVQLAGRFAALATTTNGPSGKCTNDVTIADLSTGHQSSIYSQNCAQSAEGIDSLGLDSSGFAAWRATEQVATPQPFTGVACPSSALCVAVDGHGNAATTASPTGPATSWTLTPRIAPGLAGVTCAIGGGLCAGWSGGDVVTSTAPATGAWSAPAVVDPSGQITGVACPSSALCVAVDTAGAVLTDTITAGASSWSAPVPVDPGHVLTGVACPSSMLCVATGQSGDALHSSAPASGGASWSVSSAEAGVSTLGPVACPGASLCLATDPNGKVLTTDQPSAGLPWVPTQVTAAGLPTAPAPACASTTLCLVPTGGGGLLVSTDPGAANPTWTPEQADATATLTGLSCIQGTTTCVAADGAGRLLSSTDPGTATPIWTSAAVDVPPCGACVQEQLYVQDDRGRQAIDTTQAGSGTVIAGIRLAGESLTVSWTHGGAAESFPLR
jgi:hypothetical protein